MSNNLLKKLLSPLIIALGKVREKRHFSRPPVLIVACPRSGTTILQSILSAHPHIHAIKRQTYAFDEWQESEQPEPARLDRLYRELLFHKIDNKAQRWLEKTPKHLENIDRILNYLPAVKIINIFRDGRDVVTSKHPQHSPHEYWVSPERWIGYIETALDYSNCENLLSVKYEDIIDNYQKEIKRILDFLDEQYTQEMSAWFENAQIKNSKHIRDGVQKLHSNSIGRWKKQEHREWVKEFMDNQKAVELMRKLNYIE